jgi:hypothetical protein
VIVRSLRAVAGRPPITRSLGLIEPRRDVAGLDASATPRPCSERAFAFAEDLSSLSDNNDR